MDGHLTIFTNIFNKIWNPKLEIPSLIEFIFNISNFQIFFFKFSNIQFTYFTLIYKYFLLILL